MRVALLDSETPLASVEMSAGVWSALANPPPMPIPPMALARISQDGSVVKPNMAYEIAGVAAATISSFFLPNLSVSIPNGTSPMVAAIELMAYTRPIVSGLYPTSEKID